MNAHTTNNGARTQTKVPTAARLSPVLRGIALAMAMVLTAADYSQAQRRFPVPTIKGITKVGACGLGVVAGLEVADRVAEFEAKRLKLDPAVAAEHKRSFQLGFALAGCGAASALAGTTYSRLSQRGKEAREREILAALDDAKPRPYADPDSPTLAGTVTPQPSIIDGDRECRVVQDHLPPDQALIRYCRKGTGPWEVKAI